MCRLRIHTTQPGTFTDCTAMDLTNRKFQGCLERRSLPGRVTKWVVKHLLNPPSHHRHINYIPNETPDGVTDSEHLAGGWESWNLALTPSFSQDGSKHRRTAYIVLLSVKFGLRVFLKLLSCCLPFCECPSSLVNLLRARSKGPRLAPLQSGHLFRGNLLILDCFDKVWRKYSLKPKTSQKIQKS